MQNYRKFTNASSSGNAAGVSGPAGASSTDNAIARWDGTTGRLLQDSVITISDIGTIGILSGGKIQLAPEVAGAPDIVRSGGGINLIGNDGSYAQAAISTGSYSSANPNGISTFYDIQIQNNKQIAFSDGVDFNRGIAKGGGSGGSVLSITDGSTGLGWLQTAGFKRKTADQTVTDSTTLVDDTHLTVSLAAGRSYGFKFTLFSTVVATSGLKIALGGTATHTDLISDIRMYDHLSLADSASALTDSTTVGNHTSGSTGAGPFTVTITGTTTVNAAGTFLVQFAQNAETGAAESVILLRGSTLECWDVQ